MVHWEIGRVTYLRDTSQASRKHGEYYLYLLNFKLKIDMQMIIKEGSLTYIKEFTTDEGHCTTPEEMLLGAYELIAKVYSQKRVIEAYYRTDPDMLCIRD